jgi:hypothetical protein
VPRTLPLYPPASPRPARHPKTTLAQLRQSAVWHVDRRRHISLRKTVLNACVTP